MRSLVRWLPFVVACAAIWVVSSMSRPPVPPPLQFEYADKLLHFACYAVLGGLALLGVGARSVPRTAVLAWAIVAIWAMSDEWHQGFVPGRDASVADFVADLAGATLGVGLLAWRFRASPSPKAS